MNRIEIIEKISSTVDQMDDNTLLTLANLADFLASSNGIADLLAETREAIERNELEAARRAYERRQQLIQGATGLRRRALNQIERAKKKIHDDPDSDLGVDETDFLISISVNGPQLSYDAYRLGYERGFTAARKKQK